MKTRTMWITLVVAAILVLMAGAAGAIPARLAPATLLAQGAMVTDLDGPLLLAEDRDNALTFDHKGVHPPDAALWG